jgi:putative transposase
LNQVERWFGLITQQAARRGFFRSVKDLIKKIDAFVRYYPRIFFLTSGRLRL